MKVLLISLAMVFSTTLAHAGLKSEYKLTKKLNANKVSELVSLRSFEDDPLMDRAIEVIQENGFNPEDFKAEKDRGARELLNILSYHRIFVSTETEICQVALDNRNKALLQSSGKIHCFDRLK